MTPAPAEAARPAGESEVEAVAALCRRASAELVGERGGALLAAAGAVPEPLGTTIRERLSSARHLVAVGTIDGVVVGALLAGRRDLADGRAVAAVEVLYVEPGARGVGVGEALVDLVLAWAGSSGCAGVDAPALPGMRESKNFFERAGFVTRLLVMHRPLGG